MIHITDLRLHLLMECRPSWWPLQYCHFIKLLLLIFFFIIFHFYESLLFQSLAVVTCPVRSGRNRKHVSFRAGTCCLPSSFSFYFIFTLITFPSCLFTFFLLPLTFPGFTNTLSNFHYVLNYCEFPLPKQKENIVYITNFPYTLCKLVECTNSCSPNT